ncbi:MAG TPA: sugar ABC transporter ATP-binding protein [Candidatus Angelobacter sp.]
MKKRFGATAALGGVHLAVRPGEVHALIGENGAGKSTLLNILAASLKPDAGSIVFRDTAYRPADPLQARRLGIAHIHQELSLCGHLSVAENIFLGAEPRLMGWLDRGAMNRRTQEILAAFPHPALTPKRRVGDLTIAARQIVEVCRALAQRSSLLLMDEPTSSLQRADVERLFQFIRQLRVRGVSVIYVSHFLEEVREIAGSFTVLRDGRSVLHGSLSQVSDGQLVSAMVGRPLRELFPARHSAQSPAQRPAPSSFGGSADDAGSVPTSAPTLADPEIALRVEELSAPPAVLHASFELRRGEVLGLAGLIGAGRTELLRALFGLDHPMSGTISVCGRALALQQGPKTRIAAGIGYLSEDRKGEGLTASLSVADNITLTNLAACSRSGWIDLELQRHLAEECARIVSVKAQTMDAPVRRLSGGNQQKVALARLLHQGCEIFLLDEPTRGVDVGSKAQIYELIASWASSGKAVLVVSSYLPELFGICHRLAVMRRGHLLPARSIAEWTPETVLQAAIGA